MTFGEKLRVLRRRDGYTQAELAELLGITPRTLINYERGRCCPKQTDLYMRMADLFDVKMQELIGDGVFASRPPVERSETPAKEARALVLRLNALFSGGVLAEEERDRVMYAVSEMYWRAKNVR
ncbi:MAG: helix-turn-helix domain-containing protein [Clostridia bacterium]|nr:helix-turn-helix domain-containing protein [Clostridia bacterium]